MPVKTGVYNRVAVIIASVVLEGAGLENKCNLFLVINRSKVRKARKRTRL